MKTPFAVDLLFRWKSLFSTIKIFREVKKMENASEPFIENNSNFFYVKTGATRFFFVPTININLRDFQFFWKKFSFFLSGRSELRFRA
jgi:hypothetical protein